MLQALVLVVQFCFGGGERHSQWRDRNPQESYNVYHAGNINMLDGRTGNTPLIKAVKEGQHGLGTIFIRKKSVC